MNTQYQNIQVDNGNLAQQGHASDRSIAAHAKSESRNNKPASQAKKIRILSIDGGGIKGIIPATILMYMEQMIQEKTGREDARLCDYFDMIAGTSTGGILTCAYLTPSLDPEKNGRPMAAEEALNLYLKRGGDIFDLPASRKIRTAFGIAEEKFSAKNLEKNLKEKFGQRRLSELLKPCLITSYDIENRSAFFFNQLNASKQESRDFDVWEVARATSAAPTYFEPALIDSEIDCDFPLVDGGLFANNPAMCAFVEAHKTAFSEVFEDENKPDYPACSDIMMVSIATGSVKKSYPYKKMKRKGAAGWVRPVIDIMMSASSETVDHQLQQLFNTCQDPEDPSYYRLNPDLCDADSAMDNVAPENLEALHQAGLQFITKNPRVLEEIVDKITGEKDEGVA